MKTPYVKPTAAELKKFGLLFSGVMLLLFALLIPLIKYLLWGDSSPSNLEHWRIWPWVVAGVISLWALTFPASLFILHRPWMKFAEIAGWINTRIILLLLFYVLIVPMGLMMRVFGHDPMRRKFDKSLESYRVASKPQERNHMETPY